MMAENDRKVVLYIAMSLDGYIAKPGDDLSFLDRVQKEGEDYGYFHFLDTVDTIILGRRTYDWVLSQVEYPHQDKATYVISRSHRPKIGSVEFYSGDLAALIRDLKSSKGKNIFCDGGAGLVNSLLGKGLIDTFIISIIPVLLGNGIRLFENGRPEEELIFVGAQTYETGLCQLHYEKSA